MCTKCVKCEILRNSIYDTELFKILRCSEDRLQSMWILDKVKKDSLWKITVTTPSENLNKIAQELDLQNIGYTYFSVTEKKGVMDIYSETSKQSTYIREVLKKYKVKYCITESKHSL